MEPTPTPYDHLIELADTEEANSYGIRMLLIMGTDPAEVEGVIGMTREAFAGEWAPEDLADLAVLEVAARWIDELDRHALSMLCLDYSLCPLHQRDYAICFDDEDPECAAIRAAFPNHDT